MEEKTEEDSGIITEEDKIILRYLMERQNQTDISYDAQNTKISQILAINGVIFGIIALFIDKIVLGNIVGTSLIIIGALWIFLSVLVGVLAYFSMEYNFGLPKKQAQLKNIVYNIGYSSAKSRIDELKDTIIKSLDQNSKTLDKKVNNCDLALFFEYLGIIFLFVGYCINGIFPR